MRLKARSNYPNAPNQKPKFNRSISLRWLIGLIFLLIAGCSQQPPVPGVSTSLVIPTVTNVEQDAERTIVIQSATEVSLEPQIPSLPPSPTPAPVNLRLGYTERGMNCSFITEIVVLILKQELNLNIEVETFNTANDLFTALAEQEIDVTLCYIDPDDRTKMKGRLGCIRQIGVNYWSDGQSKLQIWANGRSKANIRNQMPCALRFFEDLKLTEITFQESVAQAWIQNHANEVQAWISCVPSK